jgi:hypothetical protein
MIEQSDEFPESRMGHRDPDDFDVFDGALAQFPCGRSKRQEDDPGPPTDIGASDQDRGIYGH